MRPSEMQHAVLAAIIGNREETVFEQMYYGHFKEHTTIQALGRSVAACMRRGWLEDDYGALGINRYLHVTDEGELAFGGGVLSPQTNRPAWKALRGPKIGSTDLAAILGQDPYRGAWNVWDRIVLGLWGTEAGGAHVRRGNRQEANALERLYEVYGIETQAVNMTKHPEHAFLVSDPDGLVVTPPSTWSEKVHDNPLWEKVIALAAAGHPGTVEAKVPMVANFYDARDTGMNLEWAIQGQHHLLVTGNEWGIFLLYTPEYDDVEAFPVVRHAGFLKSAEKILVDWHEKYVVGRLRPERPEPLPPQLPTKVPGQATVRDDDEWLTMAELVTKRHWELEEAKEGNDQTFIELCRLIPGAPIEGEEPEPLEEGEEPPEVEALHLTGGGVVAKLHSRKGRRQFNRGKLTARIIQLQQEGDAEGLATLDPMSDEFWYTTDSKTVVDVKVLGPNPAGAA